MRSPARFVRRAVRDLLDAALRRREATPLVFLRDSFRARAATLGALAASLGKRSDAAGSGAADVARLLDPVSARLRAARESVERHVSGAVARERDLAHAVDLFDAILAADADATTTLARKEERLLRVERAICTAAALVLAGGAALLALLLARLAGQFR